MLSLHRGTSSSNSMPSDEFTDVSTTSKVLFNSTGIVLHSINYIELLGFVKLTN